MTDSKRFMSFGGDVRSIGEWRFEGGGFVQILVGGDVPTERAIEWVKLMLKLKEDELKRLSPDAPAEIPEGFRAPLDDRTTVEMMHDRDSK